MVSPYARTSGPAQPNRTGTAVYIPVTNPIERRSGEIKHRSDSVGIFPKEAAVVRLVGTMLLGQSNEWATQRVRYMTLEAIRTVSDNATVWLSAVPA